MNNTDNKQSRMRETTKRQIIRTLFRMLPLPLPAPELYDLIVDLKRSRTSLDEKIEEASESLKQTSELINEIEQILQERTMNLERLKTEVERYSQLADIEGEKAKALVEQLELALNKGKGQERWVNFAISIIAGLILFVFGVFASPKLTEWFTEKPSSVPMQTQPVPSPLLQK